MIKITKNKARQKIETIRKVTTVKTFITAPTSRDVRFKIRT